MIAGTREMLAWRLDRGDVVVLDQRHYRIGRVDLVVRIPRRNQQRKDPALRFTLWPVSGGRSRPVTFEQTETVRVVRQGRWAA